MRRHALVITSALMLSAAWAMVHASSAQDAPARSANEPAVNPRAVVDRYCVTCHNQRTKTSDLALDAIDITTPAANGDIWEGGGFGSPP